MNSLVTIERNVATTTSRFISCEFDIAHREIMRKIEKLRVEIPTVRFDKMFRKTTDVNDRNREYDIYKISRDGYVFLIMNISTKKAHLKKLLFIDAFNEMEKILLKKQNQEWVSEREQGKQIRLTETDAIQEFVEYAIGQGSSGAKFYYKHFTNATYKALKLLEHKKPKTRDTLDLLQLHQLVLAEDIVTNVIIDGMGDDKYYKDIFNEAKSALLGFANQLRLGMRRTIGENL